MNTPAVHTATLASGLSIAVYSMQVLPENKLDLTNPSASAGPVSTDRAPPALGAAPESHSLGAQRPEKVMRTEARCPQVPVWRCSLGGGTNHREWVPLAEVARACEQALASTRRPSREARVMSSRLRHQSRKRPGGNYSRVVPV